MSKKQNQLAEQVLYTLMQELGPKEFARALANVSMHGNPFVKNYDSFLDGEDKNLNKWFDGIELMKLSAK